MVKTPPLNNLEIEAKRSSEKLATMCKDSKAKSTLATVKAQNR